MMYRTCRLPWRNSFPRSGSCCVSNNPRGFLYLSAGYCCHWQDWPTCKVSSSKKKNWRDRYPDRQTFTHAGSQSSARLDRWLVSLQLRRWISTAPDALDQTAGYPGDHQGVTLSLTAPGGTYFGRAAWRMPLHLLEIADVITAYLQDHPTSEVLSRGQRWVHLRSSRAVDQGGIALVDIRAQLTALQAKIIGRLLEPEHIAWKAFFDSWLSMPLTAEQILSTPPQQQHIWQLGRYLPFSSFSTRFIDAPARVTAYIDAFRQLHPHRLVAVEDLPYQEVMSQPLFHSWQIQHMGTPISWEAWARQGRVRLQHLRDIILSGTAQTQPALQQEVTLLLDSMPASWAAHVCGPAPQPTHLASAAAGDSRVFCPDADGQLIHTYTVTPTAALQPALPLLEASQQPPLPADLRPVLVMDWDPTRPWHPRHMGPRARAGDADAVPAQPQPQPQLAISPHLVGAWSAGVI